MDFLNRALAQVSDLFRSMTVGARITAALLLAVVVVSLAYLFNYQMAGGDTHLFGGQSFSTSELTAMESAFSEAGLGGYQIEGSRVRIPRSQQAAYVAALAEGNALPKNWNDYLVQALDAGNFYSNSKEREERLHVAKQQELSQILRAMDDVENAAVHYDRQKKGAFGQQPNATASVMIQLVGGRTLTEERVEMIREMVAACFADLKPDKVTVSDLSGNRVHAPPGEDGLGSGGNHRWISTKSAQDKLYEKNIYDALAYVPGVVVAVNTDPDTDLTTSIEKTVHDPKAVPIDLREESTTTKSETAAPRGAPGLAAQQPPLPNQPVRISDSVKGSTSEEERSRSEVRNVVNRESTSMKKIGLTPKRVTVSVAVPSTYFEQIWRQNNPTPPGQPLQPPDPTSLANLESEEIARIRDFVVPLIPKPTDILDPTPLVTVKKFHKFNSPEAPEPGAAHAALGWLAVNWTTLGVIGLVLISLLMMRSLARSPAASSKPLELAVPLPARSAVQAEQPAATEPTSELPKQRLKRRAREGGSLREDLVEMVREDPDAAANILRNWIGNAS